ncbi:unnamed protein product [Brassica rapa subsp. narinosa]
MIEARLKPHLIFEVLQKWNMIEARLKSHLIFENRRFSLPFRNMFCFFFVTEQDD